MKLSDAKGLVDHLSGFLETTTELSGPSARSLKPLFDEVGGALAEEGLDKDSAKARKAATLCGQIADGSDPDPAGSWAWVKGTAEALRKVVRDGTPHEQAGYPDAGGSQSAAPVSMADAEIFSEFLSRQGDNIEEIEHIVLDAEKGVFPDDISGMMRFFHTLKGEAGLLGLEDMSRCAHATEDMLLAEPLAACMERLLQVKDWLTQSFRHLEGEGDAPAGVEELIDSLRTPAAAAAAPEPAAPAQAPEPDPAEATWESVGIDEDVFARNLNDGDVDLLQDFIAEAGEHLDEAEAQLLTLESEPTDADALNAVFRAFHTIKGVAGFIEMTHIQELAHKAENLLDQARKGEIELAGDPMDLTFESVDMLKKLCDDIVTGLGGDGTLGRREELPGLMARLLARCGAAGAAPKLKKPAAAAPPPAPQPAPTPPPPPPPEPEAKADDAGGSGLFVLKKPVKPVAAPEPKAADEEAAVDAAIRDKEQAPKPAPEARTDAKPAGDKAAAPSAKVQRKEAVRVDADRLDLLVETIGELVIAEAMVSQNPELRAGSSVELARNLDHLDKICRELQEIGMSLRMVPVKPVFQKMARLVRDLGKKIDRKIDFVMSGEDTELDKSVVDKIGDPLVHMLRNAVDHGIESDPAERTAKGKPAAGRIELRAYHKGGNIVIEVTDDGKGLDRDAIMAKAVDRGLVKEGQVLTDREVFALIFEPGFSTAKKVTDVSGRGVGMDVVRRNIEELRGNVEIESVHGKGSTFRFKLPLTLAIIDGMVISVGGENYIIPTLTVVRLVRPNMDDYSTVKEKGEMLRFEEELIPLYRLNRLFSIPEGRENLSEAVVVVVESDGRRVGVVTDDLIGQQQIVIKSLGEKVQGTPGIAGGAIMSDGNVALILDVAGLVKVAHTGPGHGGEAQASE